MTDIDGQAGATDRTPARTQASATGPVVVLTQGGPNPEILINALKRHVPELVVIEEKPESKKDMLRLKARRLGWATAFGQMATMAASKFGKPLARRRAAAIVREYGADPRPDPALRRLSVDSANSEAFPRALDELKPAVLFLVSCRMLKPSTLAAISCPVLNFHAGINPQYRGQQGGYWARVMGDEANFGATVHLVDAGVDTGGVIGQVRVTPTRKDTLHTYPLLLTAAGTDIAVRAVTDALAGALRPVEATQAPSRQWYHPTLWSWLWTGMTRGIW
ncbi:formyl transferase [Rhizobium sp. GN54]|uniref:formyl transferase n=1 Tax=Rhizobium sp. GN54 TaxID=2898150 RepID=UPI001E5F01AD|nr:formyl transferase [Rhizobium sp. GN54]MCD2181944.1 formyl transferase [Rhizobium sp. GN54]